MRSSGRGRGSIIAAGEGKWRIRLTLGEDANGKRIRLNKTVRGTKKDAERALTSLLKKKDEGVLIEVTRDTLGQWAEEWLTTWCNHLAPRTRSYYRDLLERQLTPELRGRKLTALTPADIQEFVTNMTARGLSPRYVCMAHGTIRTCLNQAVRLGKVSRNVAAGKLVRLPPAQHREPKFFTAAEAQRFLKEAEADPWWAFYAVMIYGGLRPGEAVGLKWEDLDGDNLRIRRAVTEADGKRSLASTKTRRSRTVPLSPYALRALARHRRRQAEWRLKLGGTYEDNDLIFASETGGIMNPNKIGTRSFKPLLKKLGLPKLRLYDLRHTHATLLLAAGEHPKVVQERLGHASITLTLNTYTHVVPGMQERAAARLEALISAEERETL